MSKDTTKIQEILTESVEYVSVTLDTVQESLSQALEGMDFDIDNKEMYKDFIEAIDYCQSMIDKYKELYEIK